MKTKILTLIAPFLLILSSCDSEVNPVLVSNALKSGTWHVSFYYDIDHEETSNYNGYNFTFGDDYIVTADDGTNTVTGTWYVNDNDGDDTELILNFEVVIPFNELSTSWHVLEKSAGQIRMEHTAGGGGTSLLTLDKN